MRLVTKVLIGTAVVASVTAIAVIASEKEEKKDKVAVLTADNEQGIRVDVVDMAAEKKEDKSVLKRIKRFVKQKFVKALAWVALHMEQIEAIGAVLGLAGAVVSIAGSVRDFAKGYETQKQLDRIEALVANHDELQLERTNHIGQYVDHCAKTINDNLRTTDEDVLALAEALGVDILKGEVKAA